MKIRWVVVGYLSAIIFVDLVLVWPLLVGQRHLHPDLSFMWAGLRALNPYNIGEVTALQKPLWPMTGPRAFVYPPSSLPLYFPFSLMSFWPAFYLWTVLSMVVFWTGARQITKYATISFLSPHVILSLCLGQTALITGGMVMWGISLLRSQPLLAGACFGIGAALKPQCFFLAPLAMVSGRHWKATSGMVLAWSMLAILTLGYWPDWLKVIQAFPAIIAKYYPVLIGNGATPSYFAQALGLPTPPFQLAGIALGVVIVWQSFRTEDNATRTIGLITGTLLASPYAIRYELAALAPALFDAFMLGTLRGAIIALPLLGLNVLTTVPALVLSGLGNLDRRKHHASIAGGACRSNSNFIYRDNVTRERFG